jgi:hypothetical protein
MITTIKRGASKEEIKRLFLKMIKKKNDKKGFDAFKFCGAVRFSEDGLEIQREMRDEWQ